ncbi:hypothetical protein [Fluviicola sp.]|uniref:hypothetical protein n=1 Tax=Fluviicola sp. TaxID=1917219 RepID=UPI0031D5981C
MFNFFKQHKFTSIVLGMTLILYLWAQLSSFKLLKSEYGTKYAPNTTHGSVHHK